MIIDSIKNFERYICLHEGFEQIRSNLKKFADTSVLPGKYEIDGERIFAVVQSYETKPAAEDKFENHRKYIDIQYMVSGSEQIHIKEAKKLTVDLEFDAEHDYEFYKTPSSYVTAELEEEEFAVFYPGEAHRPGVMTKEGSMPVRKVIFKVMV